MASLGMQNSYLPKCRFCGTTISFYQWRTAELCRECSKRIEKLE